MLKASLNEERSRQAALGKEILARKFKNWKIELNDEAIRKMLKKYGFKLAADLYYDIAIEKIDPLDIKSVFVEKEDENAKEHWKNCFQKVKLRI